MENNDLIKILKRKIKSKNKINLENILYNNIEKLDENEEILNLSIRASILINNLNLAEKLSRNSSNNEVKAIIEYSNENYIKASHSFYNSKNIKPKMRVLYSLSHYNFVEEMDEYHNIELHKKILNPIIEKSEMANKIIGIVHFNNYKFEKAEPYLRTAKELNKSETNYLNLLTALNMNNDYEKLRHDVTDFIFDTRSKITNEELEKKIKRTELKMPKVKITNLYGIVSKLI